MIGRRDWKIEGVGSILFQLYNEIMSGYRSEMGGCTARSTAGGHLAPRNGQ